ncbi:MAG: hypothetical protein KGH89_02765 [Thaumarchaeota archaeon]|nr:hypothetical protein [Nitrososphaerota archaeon]
MPKKTVEIQVLFGFQFGKNGLNLGFDLTVNQEPTDLCGTPKSKIVQTHQN